MSLKPSTMRLVTLLLCTCNGLLVPALRARAAATARAGATTSLRPRAATLRPLRAPRQLLAPLRAVPRPPRFIVPRRGAAKAVIRVARAVASKTGPKLAKVAAKAPRAARAAAPAYAQARRLLRPVASALGWRGAAIVTYFGAAWLFMSRTGGRAEI